MWEAATICPARCKLTFDLLTLKVVSESRVTWATSVPILVFLGLSVLDLGPMNATDRGQTDVRQTDCLRTAIKTSIDSLQKVFIVILQASWSNATEIKYRDTLVLFASSEKHKSIDDVVKRRIVAMCVILDLAYTQIPSTSLSACCLVSSQQSLNWQYNFCSWEWQPELMLAHQFRMSM